MIRLSYVTMASLQKQLTITFVVAFIILDSEVHNNFRFAIAPFDIANFQVYHTKIGTTLLIAKCLWKATYFCSGKGWHQNSLAAALIFSSQLQLTYIEKAIQNC